MHMSTWHAMGTVFKAVPSLRVAWSVVTIPAIAPKSGYDFSIFLYHYWLSSISKFQVQISTPLTSHTQRKTHERLELPMTSMLNKQEGNMLTEANKTVSAIIKQEYHP